MHPGVHSGRIPDMIRRQFIAALGGLFLLHRPAPAAAPAPGKIEKLRLSEDYCWMWTARKAKSPSRTKSL